MNTSTELTQEDVNAAWEDILNQWNSLYPSIYVFGAHFPLFTTIAREYISLDEGEVPKQWVGALSKDEALMFYAFVILAEGLEIPS